MDHNLAIPLALSLLICLVICYSISFKISVVYPPPKLFFLWSCSMSKRGKQGSPARVTQLCRLIKLQVDTRRFRGHWKVGRDPGEQHIDSKLRLRSQIPSNHTALASARQVALLILRRIKKVVSLFGKSGNMVFPEEECFSAA